MFSVYGGKSLSRKAVHNWVEKFFQGRSKVTDDVRPGAEVTETTVKRLLCCGFRRNGKAMGQVYQCWWKMCREIKSFPRFEYHTFYVLYPFVTCSLTLRRIYDSCLCTTFVPFLTVSMFSINFRSIRLGKPLVRVRTCSKTLHEVREQECLLHA
jgi:hypothetical protein